jgi:hypothetical protein
MKRKHIVSRWIGVIAFWSVISWMVYLVAAAAHYAIFFPGD